MPDDTEYEVKEIDGVVYRRPRYQAPTPTPATTPPPAKRQVRRGNSLYSVMVEE